MVLRPHTRITTLWVILLIHTGWEMGVCRIIPQQQHRRGGRPPPPLSTLFLRNLRFVVFCTLFFLKIHFKFMDISLILLIVIVPCRTFALMSINLNWKLQQLLNWYSQTSHLIFLKTKYVSTRCDFYHIAFIYILVIINNNNNVFFSHFSSSQEPWPLMFNFSLCIIPISTYNDIVKLQK